MVDWFSADFPGSDWSEQFERERRRTRSPWTNKTREVWAYRPKGHSGGRAVVSETVIGWRGQPVRAVSSPSGVLLLADYEDALVSWQAPPWPPPSLITRLVADEEQPARWPNETRALVTERLGFYCRLQSVNSEDAMTWSAFGPLLVSGGDRRVAFLRWICDGVGMRPDDTQCAVDLWRRVAHPRKPSASNGPELDAVLEGDRTVVFVECKWGSPEGTGQGPDGTATQMGLRREYLERFGRAIYGERRFVVLGLVLGGSIEKVTPPDSEHVITRTLTWSELCGWSDHPMADELTAYFDWKLGHSTVKGARALAADRESE
jgi:hypothetical protein